MLPSPVTVRFFLPGLVHQFGNLLLMIQGHVLYLDADSIERARQAILTATNRGAASLQVLRAMSGEHLTTATDAGELLTQMIELARVPVRERGHKLELLGELPFPTMMVATGPFVSAVAAMVRVWVEALPSCVTGTVTLGLAGPDREAGCRLQIGFVPVGGALPFPLATDEVIAQLRPELGDDTGIEANGPGLELVFPAAASTSTWEA